MAFKFWEKPAKAPRDLSSFPCGHKYHVFSNNHFEDVLDILDNGIVSRALAEERGIPLRGKIKPSQEIDGPENISLLETGHPNVTPYGAFSFVLDLPYTPTPRSSRGKSDERYAKHHVPLDQIKALLIPGDLSDIETKTIIDRAKPNKIVVYSDFDSYSSGGRRLWPLVKNWKPDSKAIAACNPIPTKFKRANQELLSTSIVASLLSALTKALPKDKKNQ